MSKKSTRSSKPAEAPPPAARAAALRKVFFISNELVQDPSSQLTLEYFYHPGKGKPTLFITKSNTELMEVIEFAEQRRCWLINNDVCSNGRIYMTTPIDVTFLALHHLRLHCTQKALALEDIGEANDTSTMRLMREFVRGEEQLRCIADIKKASGMVFYKYNQNKSLAWLAIKTRRVAEKLRSIGAYCGQNSVSQNYIRGELEGDNKEESDMDYLRMACDIVGNYLDIDLHEELTKYLEIPDEKPRVSSNKDEKEKSGKKRKSLQQLNANDNKKIKIEANNNENANGKLNSNLLEGSPPNGGSRPNSSSSEEISPASIVEAVLTPSPVKKERVLTAKEKSLAKSAKGTKSIASFFSKK